MSAAPPPPGEAPHSVVVNYGCTCLSALGKRSLGTGWTVVLPPLAWHHAPLWVQVRTCGRALLVHTHKGSSEEELAYRTEAAHCPMVGSGMWYSYSQEPALGRAMEIYFRGRGGMDTHSFTTVFLQMKSDLPCYGQVTLMK